MAAPGHHRRLREEAGGLSVVTVPRPPNPRLVPAGELDLSTAARLEEVLQCAEGECTGSLVVDLSAVSFTDCAGARPLLDLAHRLAHRGARLDVRGATPRVALVLAHLGVPGRAAPPAAHRASGWPPRAASRRVST